MLQKPSVPLELLVENNPLVEGVFTHENLKVRAFFGGISNVRVSFSDFTNSLIFYGGDREAEDDFFTNLEKRINDRRSVNRWDARLFIYGTERKVRGSTLHFKDSTFKESVNHIEEYLLYLSRVIEERLPLGFYRNKPLDIFIVFIEKNSELWKSSSDSRKIFSILELLKKTSSRILFITEDAKDVPKKFIKMSEWTAFVGRENSRFAEELFSDLPRSKVHERFEQIGFYKSCKVDVLGRLYRFDKTLSEAGIVDREVRELDKDRYLKFLESLSDGS